MYWRDQDWECIVLVTVPGGSENSSGSIGTGFVVRSDDAASYVVTCAHVVKNVSATRPPSVNGRPAAVIAGGAGQPGLDLALLKVAGRLCEGSLTPAAWIGSEGIIPGWSTFDPANGEQWARPLAVRLGLPTPTRAGGAPVCAAWSLAVTGDARPGALACDHDEARLHEGYSGAPVVCPRSGRVIAVARYLFAGKASGPTPGKSGLALSIRHLRDIWPAADLGPYPWVRVPPPVLDDEDCRWLAGLFGALPAGLTLDDLRRLARRAWPDTCDALPQGDDGERFFFWLLDRLPCADGRLPLYDALGLIESRLCAAGATDREGRRLCEHLGEVRDRLGSHHRDLPASLPPQEPERDSPPPCVEIELSQPPGGAADLYQATIRHRAADDRGAPDEVQVPRLRINPRSPVGPADLIEALYEFLGRHRLPPGSVRLVFRLPRELLSQAVDTWGLSQSQGLPLAISYPVVVQWKKRHDSLPLQLRWRPSWEALRARPDRALAGLLHWWTQCPADLAAAGKDAFQRLRRGACLGLAYPPDPGRDPDLLIHLLWDQGAPVVLWPRESVDPAALTAAAAGPGFGDTRWDRLPETLFERRSDTYAPDARDLLAPLVLLWDPPPADEPGGWCGVFDG